MTVQKREVHMSNDTRIALLENTLLHINEALISIREDIKEFKHEMKDEMKELRLEGRSHFRWIMGFLFSFFLGTFSVITAFILKIVHFI